MIPFKTLIKSSSSQSLCSKIMKFFKKMKFVIPGGNQIEDSGSMDFSLQRPKIKRKIVT